MLFERALLSINCTRGYNSSLDQLLELHLLALNHRDASFKSLCEMPFNVNITASSAIPSTIQIPAGAFAAAVTFYKSRLRARSIPSSSQYSTNLESSYGFRLKLSPIRASSSPSKIRLILKPNVDRSKVARALSSSGSYRRSQSGLVVNDIYGVSWTIA